MSKSIVESMLTAQYGPCEPYAAPGIDWLTENKGMPFRLDHPEYRIKDGKKTITGRPYEPGVSLEEIESLVKIAKRKKLKLFIERESNYNSGTVLIILTEVTVHPLVDY